jgi:CFEM domain
MQVVIVILAYTFFFSLTVSAEDVNPAVLYPCISNNCDATTICSATDFACLCQNANYIQYAAECTGQFCLPQDFEVIAQDYIGYCASTGFPCTWSASQLISVANSAASNEGSTSTPTGISTPSGKSYNPPTFYFAHHYRVN